MTIPDQLTAAIAALDEELWSIGESSNILAPDTARRMAAVCERRNALARTLRDWKAENVRRMYAETVRAVGDRVAGE
jgi:hypothetical protein